MLYLELCCYKELPRLHDLKDFWPHLFQIFLQVQMVYYRVPEENQSHPSKLPSSNPQGEEDVEISCESKIEKQSEYFI